MNDELCIIIHGFTGNPWEVAPLTSSLEKQGYQVIAPLLPGHHFEKIRMAKATAEQWLQSVENIVEHAMKEYKDIHMIGFSMGAMIAAIIASRFPISTLVMLSPAVYVATPSVFLTRVRNFSRRTREQRPLLRQAMLNNVTSMRAAPLSNVWQFQKIIRLAKQVMPSLHMPICIIHSKQDEIVDPHSSAWIYHVVPSIEKELHYLHCSSHMICQDDEVETVKQTVLAFLEHYSPPSDFAHIFN
ncbi:MAG: carboxylesterase [Bacilli bacterium]|nr:carboxylesterase [Bacilli bacterium]